MRKARSICCWRISASFLASAADLASCCFCCSCCCFFSRASFSRCSRSRAAFSSCSCFCFWASFSFFSCSSLALARRSCSRRCCCSSFSLCRRAFSLAMAMAGSGCGGVGAGGVSTIALSTSGGSAAGVGGTGVGATGAGSVGVGGGGGAGGGAASWGTADQSSASTVTGVVSRFQCTPTVSIASSRAWATIARATARTRPRVGGGANSRRSVAVCMAVSRALIGQLHRQAHALDAGALQRVHDLDHALILDGLVGADDHG